MGAIQVVFSEKYDIPPANTWRHMKYIPEMADNYIIGKDEIKDIYESQNVDLSNWTINTVSLHPARKILFLTLLLVIAITNINNHKNFLSSQSYFDILVQKKLK